MHFWRLLLVALPLFFCSASGHAAQHKTQDIPVIQRTQPRVEATGGKLGGFMLYPSVELLENLDSNIYARKTDRNSDFITRIQPGLKLNGLNKRYGAHAAFSADHGVYKRFSKENFTDYYARILPYWVLKKTITLKAELVRERLHQQRTDPDAVRNTAAIEATLFDRTALKLSGLYQRGRMALTLGAERAYIDFDNGSTAGGQTIINDDRNRFENNLTADIACDITDRSTVYWRSQWLNRDYKRPDFDPVAALYNGAERDSNGMQSLIGLRFPLTSLVSADANIGYRHQNFSDTSYKDVGIGIGHIGLTWLATRLTTLELNASRDVIETNQRNASAFTDNRLAATVSHELRRNLILQATGGIGTNDYIGIDRTDDYRIAGVAAVYKMNRYVHWRVAYDADTRSSNVDAADYTRHRVFLSSRVQF